MHIFELPLDCFRYMLSFVARDFDYHENVYGFLNLRLTCRLMDAEVLRTLTTPSFFKWKDYTRTLETTVFFDTGRTAYPNPLERLPVTTSYPEFVAAYLYLKPHLQTDLRANFSTFLNQVVESLLSADESKCSSRSRKEIMKQLCCHIHWMSGPWRRYYPFPPNPYVELPEETGTLEFNVLLASLLLGRRERLAGQDVRELMNRKSCVFGTLLEASIQGGHIDLAGSLLDFGVDLNDGSHRAVEAAVECENPEMLRLILSPKYNVRDAGGTFQQYMLRSIQHGRTEAAVFLVSRCVNPALLNDPVLLDSSMDLTPARNWDALLVAIAARGWIVEAASCNNFVLATAFIDSVPRALSMETRGISPLCCAIFHGHQQMVRFLLDRGLTCRPEEMLLAAFCSGDLPMVRFLLDNYISEVIESYWPRLLTVAVQHGTPRHNALIEAMFSDTSLLKNHGMSAQSFIYDHEKLNLSYYYYVLFRHACGYGNEFVVRKIAEAGVPLDKFHTFATQSDDPVMVPDGPVLLALMTGQNRVANLLVEMGASPIDPMETPFAESFKKGRYPKVLVRRQRNPVYIKRFLMPTDYRSQSPAKILKYG